MQINYLTLKTITTIRTHVFHENFSIIATEHYEKLKHHIAPSEFLYALFKTCKNNTAILIATSITNFLESLSYSDFKKVMNDLKDDELVFHYFTHFLEENCNTDPYELVLYNPQLKPAFPFVPSYFLPIDFESNAPETASTQIIEKFDVLKSKWLHLLN